MISLNPTEAAPWATGDAERAWWSGPGADVCAWWWRWRHPAPDDPPILPRLRQATDAATALAAAGPEIGALTEITGLNPAEPDDLERAAVLAAVLAVVTHHAGGLTLGQQIADRPTITAGRPKSHVQRVDDEPLEAWRRLVRLLDGRCNVADLALTLLDWDRRRVREGLDTGAYHVHRLLTDREMRLPPRTEKGGLRT